MLVPILKVEAHPNNDVLGMKIIYFYAGNLNPEVRL